MLAIIPARGGSKGVPRKNIVDVGGRPLVAWSILHAASTPRINRIVVSTDDDEIADVARSLGAEVIDRPGQISGDEASSESAIEHALATLFATEGYEPDLVVFLQATSPLRRRNELDSAIQAFLEEGADSMFSATTIHGFLWRTRADGHLESVSYDWKARQRRQEIGEDLMENGSFYIFRASTLLDTGNRLGGSIAAYKTHPLGSFQIDEPHDVALMEWLFSSLKDNPEWFTT
ncbi:MAG: acylneuraminate cytidylyltransferase family protein [Thermoanaerobaculia bacterium]|nr:acylneuraminate cytidylyltransferase family protein [Thermoanaerobaculia bacterium]